MKSIHATLWLIFACTVTSGILRRENSPRMVHSFEEVEPSPDMHWTPCFDMFECMKLEVPLDYDNPSAGNTHVAFIKIPSENASAEDILYNPGGPGLSGIHDFLLYPTTYTNLMGTQYNLITFDPRGVDNSGVDLDCFSGNDGAKVDFNIEVQGNPVDSSSETSLRETYVLNQGWAKRCTAVQDIEQPKAYANTVAVANDMRHYTELKAEALGQPPEESKLWYFGASYGTVLGQTFATLWPERVGRMVLDGVVDADDYFGGGWLSVLADTDASLRQYFADCITAGQTLCPFAGDSTTVADMEARFRALVDNLNLEPILVDSALTYTPVSVNGQHLKRTAVTTLYHPLNYLNFSQNLYELESHRNGTLLAESSGRSLLRQPPASKPNGERVFYSAESTSQIPCIDQAGRYNLSSYEKFVKHVDTQMNTSWVGGEMWSTQFTTSCVKYGIRPPQSQIFRGPTGSDITPPMLFISANLDPVAPLRSARKQSSLFNGSALLGVNGTAHCGYTLPSKCLWNHVQAYFADMTLPADGSICDPAPAVKPFYIPTS